MKARYQFRGIAIAAALLGSITSLPARAQVVQGTARAVDGDTLEVSGKRVRLYGIDAPESDQTCEKDDVRWACGQIATQQLSSLAVGQVVACSGTGVDQYGRMLAVCTAGLSSSMKSWSSKVGQWLTANTAMIML